MSVFRPINVLLCVLLVGACRSPTRPSVTTLSGQPTGPALDAIVSYYSQPISLSVATGLATSGEAVTSVVEVSTDAAFVAVSFITAVPPSATGTSTVLLDGLSADTTYYWRVRTTAGSGPSVVSAPSRFTVGPQLVIHAPELVQPRADSFPLARPTFVVDNAARSGPAATLTYTFEVAVDAAFNTKVASGTVPEGAGQTSFTPREELAPGATYVWRARASEVSLGVTGAFSSVASFTTAFPGDGSFRYTLVVRSPSWCQTHYTVPPPGTSYWNYPLNSWPVPDASFDGTLMIAGASLRYDISDSALWRRPGDTFSLRRDANQLTGLADAGGLLGRYGPFVVRLRGALRGRADNQGRFDGSLDGDMTIIREGIPGVGGAYCRASDFTWTLLRR